MQDTCFLVCTAGSYLSSVWKDSNDEYQYFRGIIAERRDSTPRNTVILVEITVICFQSRSRCQSIGEDLRQFSFVSLERDRCRSLDRLGRAVTVVFGHHDPELLEHVVRYCNATVPIRWHGRTITVKTQEITVKSPLLTAAEFLEAEDGYYTLVIKASFAVIERTLQFYLLENDLLDDDDFVTHEQVYARGEQAGLYSADFRDKLLNLWRNNRSRTYYREGIGSQASADRMAQLARQIHDHVLQLGGKSHECICTARSGPES